MNKNKFFVLMLALIFVLGGCGTKGNEKNDQVENQTVSEKDDQQEKIKLEFWTIQRHDMDFMQEKINEFNQTNEDNIEVVYKVMSDNYDNNLDLAFQSNQAPDIFKASHFPAEVKKGMAIPIDKYITDEHTKRFGAQLNLNNINTFDGKLYSLPRDGVPMRLIYNKDIFKAAGLDPEKPPKTLEEMVNYAKVITEKLSSDGIYGYAMNLKSARSALYRSVEEVTYISGEYPFNKEENKYDFSGFGEVSSYFAEMYKNQYMFPGCESLDIDPLRAQFAQGKIGMYMSGSWEIGVYNNQFDTDIDWAAAQLPSLTEEKPGKSDLFGAGSSFAISSQCKQPDLAWKVIDYILKDDIQKEYQELGLGISVIPSVVDQAEPSKLKGAEYFNVLGTDGILEPFPHQLGLLVEGKTYYDLFGAVILGQETVDEAVKKANEKYNRALENYYK